MRTKRILAFLTAMTAVCSTAGSIPVQSGMTVKAEEVVWGDANESGGVNVADSVAVLQHIANKDKYGLTKQGYKNADVIDPGQGITGLDALAIQMVDAGIITVNQLPMSAAGMYMLLHGQQTTEAPTETAPEETTGVPAVEPTEAPAEGTTGVPAVEPTEAPAEETTEAPAEPAQTKEEILESLSEEYRQLYLSTPYAVLSAEKKIPIIYGDLVEDMNLDSIDLSRMRRMVVNEEPYDEKADLDGDGDVDADDVKLLQDYVLAKVRCFPVYAKYDSDDDGINDYLEMEYFKTNTRKADTDGDGLTDFEEAAYTFTDPTKADSVDEGVSDADIDSDGDGLTNIEEMRIGSDPASKDSDMDRLDDGYEVNTLKTDPAKADTDGDGLTDYEEKELGLDPNKAATDGTPDGQRIIRQVIPADDPMFRDINTEDNAYALSVEIEASGYAKNCLKVRESSFAYALQDSSALGFTPEFNYDENFKVQSITLNFEIKEAFRDNVSHYFDIMDADEEYFGHEYEVPAELDGIRRLNVFKYFRSISLPMPVSTDYDVDNNIVSVTIDTFETDDNGNSYGIGSYSLVDLEVWGQLMSEPEEYTSGTVTDTQGFMRPASNVQINAGLGDLIKKTIKKVDDSIRDLISRNYQSYNARQAAKTGEKLSTGAGSISSLFGHRYAYYSDPGISYAAAAAACRAKGGHLITVTSPFEYSYLSGTLSAGKSGAYWVGASGGPGNWSWCTGESTSYARTIKAHGYSMDTCGSYFGGLGNCLVYYPGLAYPTRNRPSVSGVNGYICEWEPGAAITDADAGIFSASIGGCSLAILKGVLSASSSVDSDGDGIPDWKEINHAAIVNLGGTAADTGVAWKKAQKYVNDTKKLAGKKVEELAKKIALVFDGSKKVTPAKTNPASDDADGDGYKDSVDPRPETNDITVTELSQDYIRVDYSTVDPADRMEHGWTNSTAPSGSESISYGGNQSWFESVANDIPDKEKRDMISSQGCGLIAMADLSLYLAKRDPAKYNNSVTKAAVDAINNSTLPEKALDFNTYKKYVVNFEKKYVDLHYPSTKVAVPRAPMTVPGAAFPQQVDIVDFNYGGMLHINSNDGRMGTRLTSYFDDNGINLEATWCLIDTNFETDRVWAKRIKDLVSRDIPAIIAIGPTININLFKDSEKPLVIYEDKEVPLYAMTTNDIHKVAGYTQADSVSNHYFNVTAVIEDQVKIDNGYYNGIMYEVSSWGKKYYMSEKEMDDFIAKHSSLFTNVVYIEEK